MTKRNHDHDHDHDADRDNPANDNAANKAPVALPPAWSAHVSLAALTTALNGVDIASVAGRSGHPMMQFKARTGDGTYSFGQKRTKPELGSRWAANPASFLRGYVCFDDTGKFVDEKLAPVSQPMIDPAGLPDKGFPWKPQWAVSMKCLDGADAGVEVVFKMATDGGIKAIVSLMEEVRDRLNSGQHDGKIAPIVLLEKSGYDGDYGWMPVPLLTRVDWMPLDGPAPAPAPVTPPPAPPPIEQPRRRRIG